MLPLNNRIVYDDQLGQWRVLFNNRLVKQVFKNSALALNHLDDLKAKKLEPEYEK